MKVRVKLDFTIGDIDGAWGDWPPRELDKIRSFILGGLKETGVVAEGKDCFIHGGSTMRLSRVKEKKTK
jgi:hypothetical protein